MVLEAEDTLLSEAAPLVSVGDGRLTALDVTLEPRMHAGEVIPKGLWLPWGPAAGDWAADEPGVSCLSWLHVGERS